MRLPAALILLLSLASRVGAQPTWSDPHAAARRQLALQAFGDHFVFGQSPGSLAWYDDTYVNNSCRWDFHVMYLSGGPAYPGAPSPWDRAPYWLYYSDYVSNIIPQLQALSHPMLAWFTFYALAQGYPGEYGDPNAVPTPPVTGGPATSAPYNAQNSTYMYQYWDLFKTLMLKVNQFPTIPVVVHIEPDGWGHILLNGTYTWPNLNITGTRVCVGSSGHPDLVGFPDNILGFAWAFKKLRDTYAGQNALLITNPSAWDASYTMTGARFGAIMKELCGDWEGAVLETGDRDKGAPGSNINPPYFTSGGVPTVAITGNFANHVQWIADFRNASGLPVWVWQAASGNTVYRTCDQTTGHYEDNLVQTLLGNYPTDKTWIDNYVQAGCYGWMFNPGQGFSTHVDDTNKDGITNPAPTANNTGLVSIYADDDGGYSRLRGQAYYASPYSLSSISLYPSAATVATSTTTVSSASTSSSPGTTTSSSAPTTTTARTTAATTAAASTSSTASVASTTSVVSTSAVTSTAFASGGSSGTTTAASSTTTAFAATSSQSNAGGNSSLPPGAIAGIIIGVLLLLGLITALLVYLLWWRPNHGSFSSSAAYEK